MRGGDRLRAPSLHCPPATHTPWPPPPAGNRPSSFPLAPDPSFALPVPARVPAPGRTVPGRGKGRGAAGGLRRASPPVAAWRLAPLWQPFSAAAAAGALRSEAEAAAPDRGGGDRGPGSPAGGQRGTGAQGRQHPCPSPSAEQAERGRSAWREPAIPPFPRHLVPGLAPSQSRAAETKPSPAAGPLQPTRAGRPTPGLRPRPASLGGPLHTPHPKGASRATAPCPAPEGQLGPPFPRWLPGWTRALAAAHPGCGKRGPLRHSGDQGWGLL